MKRLAYFLFGVSFLLLLASLSAWVLSNKIIERNSFLASVNVTEFTAGFDLNESALTFGKVNLGGSVTRNIKFENNRDFSVYVYISSVGEISRLIDFEERIYLDANSSIFIPFTVRAYPNVEPGFYAGEVIIETRII